MATTRRIFCSQTAVLALAPRFALSQAKPTSRPDVAAIDRDRILQSATHLSDNTAGPDHCDDVSPQPRYSK